MQAGLDPLGQTRGNELALHMSRKLDWEHMHGREKCPISAKGGDAHMQGLFFFLISLSTCGAKGKGKETLKSQ